MLTYFPLRSNAFALLSGAPIARVHNEIKAAGLLGDVIVQTGTYLLHGGPGMMYVDQNPSRPDEDYQSPADRRTRRRGQTGISFNSAPAVFLDNDTSIRATFAPLQRELDDRYPWLQFGDQLLKRQPR